MADAGAVHGVVFSKEVTLYVADDKQAVDRLVFFGSDLGIVVHVQSEGDG